MLFNHFEGKFNNNLLNLKQKSIKICVKIYDWLIKC